MLRCTVSGHPGSGTSTLVGLLREAKGWTSLNGGEIFRAEAARRGIALEAFSELCKQDEAVDRDLDAQLMAAMDADDGPQIVESRLAGWWGQRLESPAARIWLDVDEAERARRVVAREGGDVEAALARGRQRQAADNARYQSLYSIDMDDMSPYTCIIDATQLDPAAVLAAALEHLEARA